MRAPATARHICLFRLKRPLADGEFGRLQAFADQFLALDPDILAYRFAVNESRKAKGYDLVLYSEFTSAEAIPAYVRGALHDELARYMETFVAETVVADIQ